MDEIVTYRQQANFCGKPRCRKCRDGIGHGPYWYAFHVTADGRKERVYIGKNLPPGVMNSEGPDNQGGGAARAAKPDPYPTTKPPPDDNQGGGKPRPYPTTKPPPDHVQGTGDSRSRPGDVEYGEIDALDRLLAADPGNEGVLQRLALALALAKRRGEALRACQRFFNTMRARRLVPSQETRALYEAVQRGGDLSPFIHPEDGSSTTRSPSGATDSARDRPRLLTRSRRFSDAATRVRWWGATGNGRRCGSCCA